MKTIVVRRSAESYIAFYKLEFPVKLQFTSMPVQTHIIYTDQA